MGIAFFALLIGVVVGFAVPLGNVNSAVSALQRTPALPGLLKNVVFVAKNGHDATADGSIQKPFLTVQAGMQYAYQTYVLPLGPQPLINNSSPFTRPTVWIAPGTYNDGNLVLPPQIMVQGQGVDHTRVIGDWTIDLRWTNYPPAGNVLDPVVANDMRSSWLDIALFGNIAIDFASVASNEGKLRAANARFVQTSLTSSYISEKVVNPASNNVVFQGCEFVGDGSTPFIFNSIPVTFQSCTMVSQPIVFNQLLGTTVDNLGTTSGGSFGNIVIQSANASPANTPYTLQFSHAVQQGATLTLNGVYSTVNYNGPARPLGPNIVLLGGATLAQLVSIN
jgi:hypothetical protein